MGLVVGFCGRTVRLKFKEGDVSHTVSLCFRADYVEQPAAKPFSI